MISKARLDYANHYINSLYDSTIPNSINPASIFTDSYDNFELLFPFLTRKATKNYRPQNYSVSYYGQDIYRLKAHQFCPYVQNQQLAGDSNWYRVPSSFYSPRGLQESIDTRLYSCIPGVVSAQELSNIPTYYLESRQYWQPSEYPSTGKMQLVKIPKENAAISASDISKVILHLRRFWEAYDWDKVSNIQDFKGNNISKSEFLRRFIDYMVPVYNIYHNFEPYRPVGRYLDFGLNIKPIQIGEYKFMFGEPTFVEIPAFSKNGYTYIPRTIYASSLNSVIPIISDMRCLTTFPDSDKSMYSTYLNGKRFHGAFDFSVSPSGIDNYPASHYGEYCTDNPYRKDRFRYATLSKSFGNSESDVRIGHSSYYTRQDFDQVWGYFASEIRLYETVGTQVSKEIDPQYGMWGLSDISTYYEDLDVLNRSFTFDYEGEENRLAIICYNKEELENYLNVWGIDFSYYTDWEVPPCPYPGQRFSKVRRDDVILLSNVTSQKIRRGSVI